MTVERELHQPLDHPVLAAMREEHERPDAQMARRHTREDRAGQARLAVDGGSRRHAREHARRRDPEMEHRLREQVLAQDGAERRASIAAARERRPTRALEVDVEACAVWIHDLAEQQRAPVAEQR